MEANTQRRGQGLREKIPDIKKTLDMVKFLRNRNKVCTDAPIWRGTFLHLLGIIVIDMESFSGRHRDVHVDLL
jgi:hypothetical protein